MVLLCTVFIVSVFQMFFDLMFANGMVKALETSLNMMQLQAFNHGDKKHISILCLQHVAEVREEPPTLSVVDNMTG